MSPSLEHMLLLVSGAELPAADRVWGSGGWDPPEQREALDWLTLAHLCGWSVSIARNNDGRFEGDLAAGTRWIVVACDPSLLSDTAVSWLESRLASGRVAVIARGGVAGSAIPRLAGATCSPSVVAGRRLSWIAGETESMNWGLRRDLRSNALDVSGGAEPWVTLEGEPVVAARRVGHGIAITLGFHPSAARDEDGAVTAMLRHMLIWGSQEPVAWLDFEGTMVLRMDDPGGAQNVHLGSWYYPKLNKLAWTEIARDLTKRSARLSIAYVSGWVDDGDPRRGELLIAGHPVARTPGAVYPSPSVTYLDRSGHGPGTIHDYVSEYEGIMELRDAGAGEVELHGYAHMHPDTRKWAAAPDRYETVDWFRELGAAAQPTIAELPPSAHPIARGMQAIEKYFGTIPTTLISPGDQWTNAALERALDLGIRLVDSYYLALRIDDRFCWCTHVCAPYINEPDARWFDSCLPVVGYFHDREPALEGTEWLAQCLDRWQEAGVRRFIDFRELAGSIGRKFYLDSNGAGMRLTIESGNSTPLVRPLTVKLRVPEQRLPQTLEIAQARKLGVANPTPNSDGSSSVILS